MCECVAWCVGAMVFLGHCVCGPSCRWWGLMGGPGGGQYSNSLSAHVLLACMCVSLCACRGVCNCACLFACVCVCHCLYESAQYLSRGEHVHIVCVWVCEPATVSVCVCVCVCEFLYCVCECLYCVCVCVSIWVGRGRPSLLYFMTFKRPKAMRELYCM